MIYLYSNKKTYLDQEKQAEANQSLLPIHKFLILNPLIITQRQGQTTVSQPQTI